MKKLLLLFAFIFCESVNAQVVSDTSVRATIAANIADNVVEAITPALLRMPMNQLVDLIMKVSGYKSGRRGFGVLNPTEALEIQGNLKLSGNIDFGGAKIVVSGNRNNISIKPGGVAIPQVIPPKVNIESKVEFTSLAEDSSTTIDRYGRKVSYLYDGRQIFKQRILINIITPSVLLMSNIKDLVYLEAKMVYKDANNYWHSDPVMMNGLVDFYTDTKELYAYDWACTGCTERQYQISLLYTKQ
jgi:hypothetical protein